MTARNPHRFGVYVPRFLPKGEDPVTARLRDAELAFYGREVGLTDKLRDDPGGTLEALTVWPMALGQPKGAGVGPPEHRQLVKVALQYIQCLVLEDRLAAGLERPRNHL